MPIQFPPSPSVNQEYTYEGKVWAWDGSSWVGVRQETGISKSNIWAKQNLLIPKRGFGLNSGYNGTTDQRRTKAGTIPMLKQYIERDLGLFGNDVSFSTVESGLILYLDAGNAISYPGTGTLWTDLSPSANNGTLTSGPTYSSADGGSIVFDGVNDAIVLPTITPTPTATFNAWIYINGTHVNYGAIFSNWGGGGNAYFIGTPPNATSIDVYINDNLRYTISPLSANTWNMLTISHTASTAVAYINGVQTNTASSTLTSATNVSSIGFDTSRNNYPFKGNISQALIYNRALSQAEVTQNYNALKGRYGL
jgi:hypothetical protein